MWYGFIACCSNLSADGLPLPSICNDAEPGFEPEITGSEPVVMPLHYSAEIKLIAVGIITLLVVVSTAGIDCEDKTCFFIFMS